MLDARGIWTPAAVTVFCCAGFGGCPFRPWFTTEQCGVSLLAGLNVVRMRQYVKI